MKQVKLNTVLSDPKELKIRKILEKIKPGYFITKMELGNQMGCKDRVVEKWMSQWPWIRQYQAYIRINGTSQRTGVFLNQKYKAQLVKQGLASENY